MLPTQTFYDKLITNKKIKNTKRSAHVFCTFHTTVARQYKFLFWWQSSAPINFHHTLFRWRSDNI